MQVDIQVRFDGTISVEVPDHLSESDAKLLARHVALSRLLATTDNPDAPEDAACEEYAERCDQPETAESDWDECGIYAVEGSWETKNKGVIHKN